MNNFSQMRNNIEKYKKSFDAQKSNFKNAINEIPLKSFAIDYSIPSRRGFSADGSYISYHFIKDIKLYCTAVTAIGIEQKFIWNGSLKKSEYTINPDKQYDKTFFPLFDMNTINALTSVQSYLGMIMDALEKRILVTFSEKNKDCIIIKDGALGESQYAPNNPWVKEPWDSIKKSFMGKPMMDYIEKDSDIIDLIDACNRNNHMLVGAVKDSNLKFEYNGNAYEASFSDVLEKARVAQNLENGCYYYILSDDIISKYVKYPIGKIGICYARLHPNAMVWHRIDYVKNSKFDLEKDILTQLALYSAASNILGTPVIPQNCHKYAVRLRQDSEFYKTKIESMLIDIGIDDWVETDAEGNIETEKYHGYTDANY